MVGIEKIRSHAWHAPPLMRDQHGSSEDIGPVAHEVPPPLAHAPCRYADIVPLLGAMEGRRRKPRGENHNLRVVFFPLGSVDLPRAGEGKDLPEHEVI